MTLKEVDIETLVKTWNKFHETVTRDFDMILYERDEVNNFEDGTPLLDLIEKFQDGDFDQFDVRDDYFRYDEISYYSYSDDELYEFMENEFDHVTTRNLDDPEETNIWNVAIQSAWSLVQELVDADIRPDEVKLYVPKSRVPEVLKAYEDVNEGLSRYIRIKKEREIPARKSCTWLTKP